MELTRRGLLQVGGVAALGGVGAALLGSDTSGAQPTAPPAATASTLPAPAASGIDHIVVLMMENRSFDHFLGWRPGADGKQAGLRYVDRYGATKLTHHLADYQNCTSADPDHSYEGGRIEFNRGKCDGWLRAGDNDTFAIGYYNAADLAFWSKAALEWTVCDRYFAATMAETYPNRFYQHAARTDRTHNSTTTSTLPTIWDRLAAAGVTGRYYFSDVPFLALWGIKYIGISSPVAQFIADAAAGTLPQVSFVDPRFIDEGSGTSGDDHPHGDIRVGETFLNQIYTAVTTGPAWANTLLVVNYDEWGGFFDHVAPAKAPDADAGNALRGFRVPALVVSPRARRGAVAHQTYDHTSVLKTIAWRWGLQALTPRDAGARNIAELLDFSRAPDLRAGTYTVPPFVAAPPCGLQISESAEEWQPLKDKALADGWTLP